MNSQTRNELLSLIDALCDERLDEAGMSRLAETVQSDPEARRLYVDAMLLHGLLHWDAVQGTSLPSTVALDAHVSFAKPATKTPGAPNRWRAAMAAAAAVVAVVVYALQRPAPPKVDGPGAIAERTPGDATPKSTAAPDSSLAATPLDSIRLTPIDPPVADTTSEINVAPPAVRDAVPADGLVAFIDARLEQGWHEADIEPSPIADDAEWIRRVSLDLSGRIPDVGTVDAFLADPSPRKRQAIVNRLLDDPTFADHMSTVWTNLLVGRAPERDIDRGALARFLREQFGKNRPWTETVTELVAAEGTEHDNGAANFLLAHLNNQAVPATAITARIFLCEQVQCAQCHLHPLVKNWGQDKFWDLNAFFSQTRLVERSETGPDGQSHQVRALENVEEGGPTYYETLGGVVRVAYPKFDGTEVPHDPGVNRRRELARLMSQGDHPQVAAAFVNRLWAQFFGRGFTFPIDDMGPHNPPAQPEILAALTDSFVTSGFDVRDLVQTLCSLRAYQLSSRPSASNSADAGLPGTPALFSRMYLKPLTAEQLFDSLILSTNADRGGMGTWSEAARRREVWLGQFYSALHNEENVDATTFDGTLPQALVMMNGELIQEATSARPGTYLHDVLGSSGSENEKLRRLCLSALSREATAQEVAAFRQVIRRDDRSQNEFAQADHRTAVNDALTDAYWAYLNSAEFLVNH